MEKLSRIFDAVIFDVDGTIWNSTGVAARAYNAIFEQEGISLRVDGERLKTLFGKPMDVIFNTLLSGESPEKTHELGEKAMDYENEILEREGAEFFPGIYRTFEQLSEKIPLFIVSNCQCGYIEVVIKSGHLEPFVTGYLCFGDTGMGKGFTIKALMEKYKLKNPIYVGDIQGDADACKEAGIPIIYCAYGFGQIEDPYAVISKPLDLLDLF